MTIRYSKFAAAVVLFLFCFNVRCWSQVRTQGKDKIDSLLKVLPELKNDTNRVTVLSGISWEYSMIDVAEALKYGKESLSLAKTLGWKKGIAQSTYILGICYATKSDARRALECYNEAASNFKSLKMRAQAAKCYASIASLYLDFGKYPLAIQFYESSLKEFEALGDKSFIATNLTNLAKIYTQTGELKKGMALRHKALQIFNETGDKRGMAFNLQGLANGFQFQGDNVNAMKYLMRSEKLFEQLGDKEGLMHNASLIGAVLTSQEQFDKARAYYRRSLRLARELGSVGMQAGALFYTGVSYYNSDSNTLALQYYKQAAELFKQTEDEFSVVGTEVMMAAIYAEADKDYDKAIKIYDKALLFYRRVGQRLNEASVRNNIAQLLLEKYEGKLKDADHETGHEILKKAIRHLTVAAEIHKENNYAGRESLVSDYQQFAKAYELMNDYKKANGYLKLYQELKDSVSNKNNVEAVAHIREQYEAEKKDQQIALLNKDKTIQSALLKNTQKNRNMIISALLGVLILSGVIFYWRNKHNKLVFRNKLTETELNLFRSQMNPHFMFNALNSIHSYVITNERDNAVSYLEKFSELMHIILENSSHSLVPLADDLKALELYMELEAERLERKFSYEIKVDDALDTDRIMVPPMILQPFLENSVWHGMIKKENGGKIQLHVGRKGELLECTITDNGNGFRQSNGKGLKDGKKSYGINITRQRIENLNRTHKVNGYCNVSELFDEHRLPAGVKVEVGLPLELQG